jgi:hypothetical protein
MLDANPEDRLNGNALKSRSGPIRQPRVNQDGPGGDGYFENGGKEKVIMEGFLTANPGQVPNNRMNVSSFEGDSEVSYQSPYGDWSTVGQGAKATIQPPVPVLAMQMHPDIDYSLEEKHPHVGYGSGPAPHSANEFDIPQQPTFGMKANKGMKKSPYGTKFGLGPMGSGPQRNVKNT